MEKIEALFLGIKGFEAFALTSLLDPTGTAERVRSWHL